MLNIQEDKLVQVLQRVMPGLGTEAAVHRARELISDTDSRLQTNVLEWMEGHPVSDIWIGRYCINAILAIRKDADFLSALDAMNLYLQDPTNGELLIWRARR